VRRFLGEHAARAQACRRRSEGSARATHFYELDVQVKGMGSLEGSLVRRPARRGRPRLRAARPRYG